MKTDQSFTVFGWTVSAKLYFAAAMPFINYSMALFTTCLVVLMKWILVGRYRPRNDPLWSTFVWRSELITGLYEGAVVPSLLQGLR